MKECLFCKIIKGEVPTSKLYEDDMVIVIMDAYPDVDGHVLVIPKKHYESLMDIPDDLLVHINKIAKKYITQIMTRLNAKSLSLCVNYGESQMIKHYHLHLLPNKGYKKSEKSVAEVYEVIK